METGAEDRMQAAELLLRQRWAALATVDERRQPQASMAAYAVDPGFAGIWLHLSQLAAHSRNLLNSGVASLVISEPDGGDGDPQTLARISLTGPIQPVAAESKAYAEGKVLYLQRFPAAEQRFGFSDFILFRMQPDSVRYVGGFGRARSFSFAALAELAN